MLGAFCVQQLDPALEHATEDIKGKLRAWRFVGPNVVESLLKRQPVQRGRAVRQQLIQHLVQPVLGLRRFQVRIVSDVPGDADGVADALRLYDQLEPVGERHHRRVNRRFGNREPLRRLDRAAMHPVVRNTGNAA